MGEEYRGEEVRTNEFRANKIPFGRSDMGQGGGGGGGATQLWDAVGYPSNDDLKNFKWHRVRYEIQSEAAGLIDKFSADTWGSDAPTIEDDADKSDEKTAFEKQCEMLFSGETLRRQPGQRLLTADRLGMLGKHAVIVFGFNDGGNTTDKVGKGSFSGLKGLNFIHVYDEGRITEINTVEDFQNKRFGLPKSYTIQISDDKEKEFHHSRCIHVALGTTLTGDDLHGNYFLKNIAHELVNIDKIKAGGAEGYWRGHYQGLVLKPPKDENGVPVPLSNHAQGGGGGGGDDSPGSDAVRQQIQEYDEQYQRAIATTGEIEPLGTQVADPTPHLESQFRSISAAKDIPLSIMLGNERGDIATSEDRSMYHETLAGRRNRIAKPLIVRPIIDRLSFVGVLPDPAGGGYSVTLPPLEEITAMERSEIFKNFSEGAKALTGDQTDLLATWAEYRTEWLDWGEERGSESDKADAQPTSSGSSGSNSTGSGVTEPTAGMDEESDAVQAQADRMNMQTPADFLADGGRINVNEDDE